MRRIPLRTLVFQDSGLWHAQCLEFDICVQSDSRAEVLHELTTVLRTYIELAKEEGGDPFAGLPPAPAQFKRIYERSSLPWTDEPVAMKEAPPITPGFDIRVRESEFV